VGGRGIGSGKRIGWLGRASIEDRRYSSPALALLGSCLAAEAFYLIAVREVVAWKMAVPLELSAATALALGLILAPRARTTRPKAGVWVLAMPPAAWVGAQGLVFLDKWLRLY
jgi:hypothetical protein